MTPAELLQFARRIPSVQGNNLANGDDHIQRTNFRELVWPEHWQLQARTRAQAVRPLQDVEQQDEEEEEELQDGLRTGTKAHLTIRGKSHLMTIGQEFPDGEYLCMFDKTGNTIKVPVSRLDKDTERVLHRRKEGGKRKDGQ